MQCTSVFLPVKDVFCVSYSYFYKCFIFEIVILCFMYCCVLEGLGLKCEILPLLKTKEVYIYGTLILSWISINFHVHYFPSLNEM